MSLSRPSYPPTKGDWLEYNDTIKQLYQENTLKNVMAIMETRHGFRATERMYKARLPAMNVRKYRRRREHKPAPLNVTTRSQTHEPAQRMIAGSNSFTSPPHHTATAVEVWAPPLHSQLNYPLTPPNSALDVESIVFHVRQYTEGQLLIEATHPLATQDVIRPGAPILTDEFFFQKIYKGLALLEQGQQQDGFAVLGRACDLVQGVFRNHSRLLLRTIFMVFGTSRWDPFTDIRLSFLRYLFRMATTVLKKHHPTTQVLRALRTPDALGSSAELSLKCMLTTMEKDFGPVNPEILRTKRNLAVVLRRQADLNQAEDVMRAAVHVCELQLGEDHVETLRCMRRLATLYMHRGAYTLAEELLLKTLKQTRHPESTFARASSSSHTDDNNNPALPSQSVTHPNADSDSDTDTDTDTLVYATRDLVLIAMQQNNMPKTRFRLRDFAWVCAVKLNVLGNRHTIDQHTLDPNLNPNLNPTQHSTAPAVAAIPDSLTMVQAETRIKDLVMAYDLHCDELASRLMSIPGPGVGVGDGDGGGITGTDGASGSSDIVAV